MSHNSFGHLFRVTTWGESHGPRWGVRWTAPPRVPITENDIQHWLDRRKPGQNRFTTQRREADAVKILSGVFEHPETGVQVTTGTPIQLVIENTDQRSKDYGDIKDKFGPVTPITPIWKNMACATIAVAGVNRRAKPPRVQPAPLRGHIARSHHSWRAGANGPACN